MESLRDIRLAPQALVAKLVKRPDVLATQGPIQVPLAFPAVWGDLTASCLARTVGGAAGVEAACVGGPTGAADPVLPTGLGHPPAGGEVARSSLRAAPPGRLTKGLPGALVGIGSRRVPRLGAPGGVCTMVSRWWRTGLSLGGGCHGRSDGLRPTSFGEGGFPVGFIPEVLLYAADGLGWV